MAVDRAEGGLRAAGRRLRLPGPLHVVGPGLVAGGRRWVSPLRAHGVGSERGDGRVSVVVITRDRAGVLEQSLRRLCALAERPAVIVVDNASRDDTIRMVRTRFPRVTLVALERN